jgi:hypothetical protein
MKNTKNNNSCFVTRGQYNDLYRKGKSWEILAKKALASNVQLANYNHALLEENTLYILKGLRTEGSVYKKV